MVSLVYLMTVMTVVLQSLLQSFVFVFVHECATLQFKTANLFTYEMFVVYLGCIYLMSSTNHINRYVNIKLNGFLLTSNRLITVYFFLGIMVSYLVCLLCFPSLIIYFCRQMGFSRPYWIYVFFCALFASVLNKI